MRAGQQEIPTMGMEREASGNYLNQPLTIEEQNERELQHARWHAQAMLDRVTAAAKASAEAAARVALLEQAKAGREALVEVQRQCDAMRAGTPVFPQAD